ncbi:MAG: hypothetical protein KDA41_08470, partial [Planctomycetales bacterium]|nr:hypothetical protein [Planctomycetales bacterium]
MRSTLTSWNPVVWNTRRLVANVSIAAALAAFASGCSRPVELLYTDSSDVENLPKEQREEIKGVLTSYYGTAADPQLNLPSAEGEDGAEEGAL